MAYEPYRPRVKNNLPGPVTLPVAVAVAREVRASRLQQPRSSSGLATSSSWKRHQRLAGCRPVVDRVRQKVVRQGQEPSSGA